MYPETKFQDHATDLSGLFVAHMASPGCPAAIDRRTRSRHTSWRPSRNGARNLLALGTILSATTLASSVHAITLADNNATTYTIVATGSATDVDDFAMRELTEGLKAATGAHFRTVPASEAAALPCRIFVGLSKSALKLLGGNPLEAMEDQEFRVHVLDQDLFLYGKGVHGNLYAVYDFLEKDLGWRSFSAFEEPKVPRQPRLMLPPIDRSGQYAFTYRFTSTNYYLLRPASHLFLYRNRLNLGLQGAGSLPGIRDFVRLRNPGSHSLFAYVPPQETPRHGINPPLEWLVNKNYYKSNPEFFSLSSSGKRTDTMQLCFSNTALRQTLTANVEEHVRRSDGRGIFTVDANDVPGSFCFCEGCKKLAERYGATGGPLIDYLLELSAKLRERYPEAMVKFLAYRKEQSQRPPKIDRLPDNLVVVFAPIDDNFAADWSHPTNKETYEDLRQWCRIARNVWVWYYPNTYSGKQIPPPFGNVNRLVNDIRLMKAAGCNGAFFEHDVGVTEGLGFSELQAYLQLRLFQNPDVDSSALIQEFTDHAYGKAAPLVRAYLAELEKLRTEMCEPLPWNARPTMFRYVTPETVHRWERSFDDMEKLVATSPQQLLRIRLLRASVDLSALRYWHKAREAYPTEFANPDLLESRIRAAYGQAMRERVSPSLAGYGQAEQAAFEKQMESVLLLAKTIPKPVPEPLSEIEDSRISQAFPNKAAVKDPDAALGVAKTWQKVELPLSMGVYDNVGRKWAHPRAIPAAEIVPDEYRLYRLGRIKLTSDSLIWIGAAWDITVSLDQFYVLGDPDTEWDAYVSLKFEGAGYSPASKSAEDRVSCDRVILVRAAR